MAASVLVFVERRDGEVKRPAFEALGRATVLARTLGGSVDALALGPGASDDVPALAAHGADRVYVVEEGFLATYAAEAYAAALAEAARRGEAGIVLVPATAMGKDLGARAAARLGTACASDLIEVAVDPDGTLRGLRPVYSGKALAKISIPTARPAVATLRPNAFPSPEADASRSAEVVPIESPVSEGDLGVRTARVESAEQADLDVAEASIIVAGGRGLKEPENFSVVRELADALGAAVGASRAVVDAGWIPHASQVGQTGKVVSPNLYIACGISGAIQHLAGMSSSKVIVAINKDAEAPIFKVADYGIVGDLFAVLPALTAAVRELKS